MAKIHLFLDLQFCLFAIKSDSFNKFHFSESVPYSNLCAFELVDYDYDYTEFTSEMLAR